MHQVGHLPEFKEDQCQIMRQRSGMGNVARNFNVHDTTEGHSNRLKLTHLLPHDKSIKVIIRILEFEEIKRMNLCVTCIMTHLMPCV